MHTYALPLQERNSHVQECKPWGSNGGSIPKLKLKLPISRSTVVPHSRNENHGKSLILNEEKIYGSSEKCTLPEGSDVFSSEGCSFSSWNLVFRVLCDTKSRLTSRRIPRYSHLNSWEMTIRQHAESISWLKHQEHFLWPVPPSQPSGHPTAGQRLPYCPGHWSSSHWPGSREWSKCSKTLIQNWMAFNSNSYSKLILSILFFP